MKASALGIPKPRLPVAREEDWRQQELFEADPRPEMLCFRGQTMAIMRHFFEISSQLGRLPSLLGREFFRAKVSHHAIPSFEEQAVFVRDVELCLERLSEEHAENDHPHRPLRFFARGNRRYAALLPYLGKYARG